MTEPDVASSDATNIATRISRDGDELVITGRKWWITGAADPRCRIALVLGVIVASLAGNSSTAVGLAAVANGLLLALAPPAQGDRHR